MPPRKYATIEERELAAKQRRVEQREAINNRLLSAISMKHVHQPTITLTVTVEKPIKDRKRAMLWRCGGCTAVFDGEYWYKREVEE